jgi:hypothetical protein
MCGNSQLTLVRVDFVLALVAIKSDEFNDGKPVNPWFFFFFA